MVPSHQAFIATVTIVKAIYGIIKSNRGVSS